jgi:hypothetical protein
MLNFKNFEYANIRLPDDADEKQAELEKLRLKFEREVRESEVCKKYFSKYDPDSIDEFVDEFVKTKVELVVSLGKYLDMYHEDDNERYLKNARSVLNCILQKKLFNLQLQWRAGLIRIEELHTTWEFNFWERNIEHCPFIPAITSHELDIMKQFLLKDYYRNLETTYYWQDYDAIMKKNDDSSFDDMPDWYVYYDTMFGTNNLLILPNIREEREEFYLQLARHEKQSQQADTPVNTTPPGVYLPRLYKWFKDILDFAGECEENQYFRELFKLWYKQYYPDFHDPEYYREYVDEAVYVLESADRPVMLNPNMVWHKALSDGAYRYITERTLEVLDSVYDEYKTLIDLGISNRFTPEEEAEAWKDVSYLKDIGEMILRGRELNGEPRNFDF